MRSKPVIICLLGGAVCLFWAAFGYFQNDKVSEIVWCIAALVCFASARIRLHANRKK